MVSSKKKAQQYKFLVKAMPICAVVGMFVSVLVFYITASVIVFVFIFLIFTLLAIARFHRLLVPLLIIGIMLLTTLSAINKAQCYSKRAGERCILKFAVASEPINTLYSTTFKAYSKGKALDNNSAIFVYAAKNIELEIGKIYSAAVELKSIEENKAYYYSENIFTAVKLLSTPKCIGSDALLCVVGAVREYVRETLYSNLFTREAALLNALTVGERNGFSKDFEINVRRAGVSHVMVVSGLHLSIIMTAIYRVFDKICHNRYLRALLSVGCVIFISAVCGFTVSVVRAGLTFVIMSLAPILSRESDAISNLGTAALIILIISPFAVFSTSYQLSVLATYGILVFTPSVMNAVRYYLTVKPILPKIISMAVVTLSATFFTLPIIIYRFGEVSIVALMTNLLISYAVTYAIELCMVALIIKPLSFLGMILSQPLFLAVEYLAKYIIYVIELFGEFKYAAVSVPKEFAFIAAVLPILAVALMNLHEHRIYLYFLKQRRKKRGHNV